MNARLFSVVLALGMLGGMAWWLGKPAYGHMSGDWGHSRQFTFHPKFAVHQLTFSFSWNPTEKDLYFYAFDGQWRGKYYTYGVEQWQGEWNVMFGTWELRP